MTKFFLKLLKILFKIFIGIIIFLYIFSIKTNMSFENSIAYFKLVGNKLLNKNSNQNITINNNINSNDLTIITSSNNGYYYNQLDDTSKIIYNALYTHLDNLKNENYIIDFDTTFNELLNQANGKYKLSKAFQSALDAFLYDHPELFYIDITKISLNTTSISIGSIKTYTVQIVPSDNKNYLQSNFKSKQEVELAINKVENIKKDIIKSVKNKSVYNKLKTVHDLLVNSIEYDTNGLNKYNIYGALVENKVVCEGYAKAFKYILDSLNIECILVVGTATNSSNQSEPHMWNYVRLNDIWYGVDVTWDDPVIIGGSQLNNLRQDYFLKGTYVFNESHSPNGKISDNGMYFSIPRLSAEGFYK